MLGLASVPCGSPRMANVRYDGAGMPVAIVGGGSKEGFKTQSSIAARLCPEVADALGAWRKVCPEPFPERPTILWRGANGEIEPARSQSRNSLRKHWKRLRKKWQLPSLRMYDFRHWVVTQYHRPDLRSRRVPTSWDIIPPEAGA